MIRPATVIGTRGETGAIAHVEGALKTSAMMTSLLLLAMIYCAGWVATGRTWAGLLTPACCPVPQ